MGQVYSAPKGFDPPDIVAICDIDRYFRECRKYETKLRAWARKNGSGPGAGEIVRFPVADGQASYVVFSLKPVKLIHVETGDAYQFQYAERLTAGDIRKRIDNARAVDRLFRTKG